jgi:mono/diheme cytochrome c family protein
MKNSNLPSLAVLLMGLMLSACDKAPDSATAPAPTPQAGADTVSLNRDLDPVQVVRGRVIYDQHCAECHGAQGKGQPGDWRVRDTEGKFPPPPLDDSAHAWHHPTAVLLEVTREGSPQGQGNMPAWKDKLSEQDMQDVVVYIKTLWSDQVYRHWLEMEQQSLGG